MKLRILALLIFMASYFNFIPMAYAEVISTKPAEIEVVKNGKLNYNELNKRLQQVENSLLLNCTEIEAINSLQATFSESLNSKMQVFPHLPHGYRT